MQGKEYCVIYSYNDYRNVVLLTDLLYSKQDNAVSTMNSFLPHIQEKLSLCVSTQRRRI